MVRRPPQRSRRLKALNKADTTPKLLRLIGLGARGRLVVVGVDQVRSAAQRGKLEIALVAPDASRNSLDKVVPLLKAKGIEIIEGLSASQLGAAVDRDSVAVIGITDPALAKGIKETASVE